MTITRIGFCKKCQEAERPRYDNFFVASGSKGWHVYRSKHIGKPGFVPTLYRPIKILGENVVYEKQCAMHDCSVDIIYSGGLYHFKLGQWERGIMDKKSWDALIALKDTGYEI